MNIFYVATVLLFLLLQLFPCLQWHQRATMPFLLMHTPQTLSALNRSKNSPRPALRPVTMARVWVSVYILEMFYLGDWPVNSLTQDIPKSCMCRWSLHKHTCKSLSKAVFHFEYSNNLLNYILSVGPFLPDMYHAVIWLVSNFTHAGEVYQTSAAILLCMVDKMSADESTNAREELMHKKN